MKTPRRSRDPRIGKFFAVRWQDRGLSQRQVAELLKSEGCAKEISAAHIDRVVRDESDLLASDVAPLCDALGLNQTEREELAFFLVGLRDEREVRTLHVQTDRPVRLIIDVSS